MISAVRAIDRGGRVPSRSIPVLLLLTALTGCSSHTALADKPAPTIRLMPAGDDLSRSAFELVGLPPESLRTLAADTTALKFVVKVNGVDSAPPVAGLVIVETNSVLFKPRFPLEPGVRYRAEYHAEDGSLVSALFELPRPKGQPRVKVVSVDPALKTWPANLLRLYVRFSEPPAQGVAYDHVHLLDADGKPLPHPFLELGEELWDPTGTRLTLLFDPGRVKRDLRPHIEDGPVLEEGKTYTFLVDADWPDPSGQPMVEAFRRHVHVGPPDETPIDPKTWRIQTPAGGRSGRGFPFARHPLTIEFGEPLDRGMTPRMISVRRSDGTNVEGTVQALPDGRSCAFAPDDPWARGRYEVVVSAELEDLAGNQVGRPFEVDVTRPVTERPERPPVVTLPFELDTREPNVGRDRL